MYLLHALVGLVGLMNARLARGQARSLPFGLVLGLAALLGSTLLGWAAWHDAREPQPAPLTVAQVAAGTARRFIRITGTAIYQNGVVRKAGDQFQAFYYPVLDPDNAHVLMVKANDTIQGDPERVAVVGVLRPMDPLLMEAIRQSGPFRGVLVNATWLLDTSYTRVSPGWGLTSTIMLIFLALVLLFGSSGAWTAFTPDMLRGLAGVDPIKAAVPVRITGWLRHESGMELFVHLMPTMLMPEDKGLSIQTSISFTWYGRAGAPSYSGIWRLAIPAGAPVRFGYVFEGFAQRPALRWHSGKRGHAYLVFDTEREAAAALHALDEKPLTA